MWTLSQDGRTEYLIAEPDAALAEGDEVLARFFDVAGVLDWLQGLPQRALTDEALRACAWEHLRASGEPVSGRAAAAMLVAWGLLEGRLHIVARAIPAGGGGARRPEEQDPLAAPAPAPLASSKVHWIEIVLLEHDLRPAAGERYRIQAPDGSAREGKLDAAGAAFEDHLDAGNCRVSFPDLAQRYSRRRRPATNRASLEDVPTLVVRHDAYGETFRLATTNRHVLRLEIFHHVSVALVDCDHVPLPPQGTVLALPGGGERRPDVGAAGVVRYAPAPPGVCTLTVEDASRVPVRFPTVPDDDLVIVVRVPPRPVETGDPAPFQRPPPVDRKVDWIEIALVDGGRRPIPHERYRIEAPGGSVREGTLDGAGRAREERLDPGRCRVTFPDIERRLRSNSVPR
jgi:hypothetical protein